MTSIKEALEGLIEAVKRDANEPGGRGISGYTSARLSDAAAAIAQLDSADAARMREALELSRKAIEQAICCVRGDTPEDCTDEEARNDTLSKLRDADGAIYAALAPADGEVKP